MIRKGGAFNGLLSSVFLRVLLAIQAARAMTSLAIALVEIRISTGSLYLFDAKSDVFWKSVRVASPFAVPP